MISDAGLASQVQYAHVLSVPAVSICFSRKNKLYYRRRQSFSVYFDRQGATERGVFLLTTIQYSTG
jgi:hypothetical protein